MRIWWALLGVVLLATGAAYLPSIDGAFLLDDVALQQDPLVLDPLGHGPSDWLASGRPLALLTFALNFAAVGLDPRGWHLTNVAIHLGAVALAFLLARLTLSRAGLSRPEGPALAAAALFALHPLQTESVAYLSQRAESLASGLFLAALLLLLRRDEAAGQRRPLLLAGAVALHLLGLLTKPIAATLPVAWLVHAALLPAPSESADRGPRGAGAEGAPGTATGAGPWPRLRARLPAALPLLALSVLAAVRGVASVQGSSHAGFDIPDLPAAGYLATQARAIPTYLRLLAVPAGQCADWDFPASRSFAEPAVLGGLLLLGALLAGALWLARWSRGRSGDGAALARTAAFGVLFFLVVLAPSSGVVPLRDPLAEHRVYLAALGPFVAAAAGVAVLLRRLAGARAPLAGGALAAAVLAVLGALTAGRAAVWTTPLAFWQDATRQAAGKARVQQNLGHALLRAGKPVEALAAFERALSRQDDGTVIPHELLTNTLSALYALGRIGEARARVDAALRASPEDPVVLGMLARAEFAAGHDEAAVRAARAALARDPGQPGALKYLGLASLQRGDAATALSALRAAGAQNGLDPAIYVSLGRLESSAGNRPAACAAWERALRLPGSDRFLAEVRQGLATHGCR
jgi:tetratricopeptide (TPR) repeat protein